MDGPVLTIGALGISVNLYSQIGLILLVALSAKNAILIVEYARHLRDAGKSLSEAAVAAALERFRPILMTSIAFSAGVVRSSWQPAQAPMPACRSGSRRSRA